MSKPTYLTEEGLINLKAEIKVLKTVDRPAISAQIAEARDKGDLSENAEYDAAKEAQGLLEAKIAKLQTILVNSRILDVRNLDTDTVKILHTVKIRNTKNSTEMSYTIVPGPEANLKKKKLSIDTPIAKGLLGKKIGDKVSITVPSGIMELELLDISLQE